MNDLSKPRATWLEVGEESAAQRIDNFLLRRLKGVPKSHLYRVLRSGEVRVNSGRVRPEYRLKPGDKVRLPPVRVAERNKKPPARPLELKILHEDPALVAIDKPSGTAVHGGSGVSFGLIEGLRAARPQVKFLELVHRLDRDTSGVLLVAKKRSALTEMHRKLRQGEVEKLYIAMVKGRWVGGERELSDSLHKYVTAAGERRVRVEQARGKAAVTKVRPIRVQDDLSLLELRLVTGRTHQIRVHLAHAGHPVIGDDKYGDFELNKRQAKAGAKRLMLHARRMAFAHPVGGDRLQLESPLPPDMKALVDATLERAA
ncbi:MAG: RluA family pseudouridine synthase [Betaproteobacteria bacterium]|nr:RluA family pseudouridine synthase [Betaproteobacteria bacterium]